LSQKGHAMLEIGILIVATAVGATMLWTFKPFQSPVLNFFPHLKTISRVAKKGYYLWGKLSHMPTRPSLFDGLHLIEGGIALTGKDTVLDCLFSDIQARGEIHVIPQQRLASLQLFIEQASHWYCLELTLTTLDMANLVNVLRRAKPQLPIINVNKSVWRAKIAQQTLQGESSIGQEVDLVLLGQTLIVLHNSQVQAKLTLESIKRVITTDRNDKNTDGFVRLYSPNDTILFVVKQHRAFAQRISELAKCPIDFVQDRKPKE
jgi:hypothetical protein